jgi:hypothetical protein
VHLFSLNKNDMASSLSSLLLQLEELIINSAHFPGTVGKLCVLPGSYTVVVKRPKLASCTIHVQLASADVKTASCK